MFRPLTSFQLGMDIAAAVVFFAVFGFMQFPNDGVFSWWGVVVSLAMAGALAVRRLAPPLALGIAWAGAILQMSVGLNPMPSNIAIFAVLYVTAAYGSRVVFWCGFASSLIGALVITLYVFLGSAFLRSGLSVENLSVAAATWIAATFALLLSWTVGALVRTALRARQNRAAQKVAEGEAAAEQERVRIARDMHDVVAHSLAVVIAQADGARYAAASDPDAATAALATISTTARAALADVRLLLTQLRHSQSDGPQPTLADLEGLYAQVRAAGVGLQVEVDPVSTGEPSASVQLAVYRILQEALTNAMRHGDGGPVSVRLSWLPDHVELEVRNTLSPTTRIEEPSRSEPLAMGDAVARGHGLIGMRERAQLVGGSLEAGTDGAAFAVRAALPIGVAE